MGVGGGGRAKKQKKNEKKKGFKARGCEVPGSFHLRAQGSRGWGGGVGWGGGWRAKQTRKKKGFKARRCETPVFFSLKGPRVQGVRQGARGSRRRKRIIKRMRKPKKK